MTQDIYDQEADRVNNIIAEALKEGRDHANKVLFRMWSYTEVHSFLFDAVGARGYGCLTQIRASKIACKPEWTNAITNDTRIPKDPEELINMSPEDRLTTLKVFADWQRIIKTELGQPPKPNSTD